MAVGALCLVAYLLSDTALLSQPPSPQTKNRNGIQKKNAHKYLMDDNNENVVLLLPLEEELTSMGPHQVQLLAPTKHCPHVGFWLRLEGDALETVLLEENGDTWEGSFHFPIPGRYEVVAYWKGCDYEPTSSNDDVKRMPLLQVKVTGNDGLTAASSSASSLFPKAAWITSQKFKDVPKKTPYVWHDPSIPTTVATLISTTNSTVSKEGAAFAETGFYLFRKLSNYELVCWVGSQSAADSRNVFLEERRTVSAGQRPFKFHIYSSNNFVHPAEDWPENEQWRFRKCKHILVSMDQTKTPLTQQEYSDQVTTFLDHLLKAFPDETFPIWMFTVNESPMAPTNCLPPYTLKRTSDHPCNDVLKALFAKNTFPERVHLLDNTALTLPQLGDNAEDLKAAIALRIFVFVGKRVQDWRNSGQEGRIDGLHRGEEVEPNFELVPYPEWQ